MIEIRKYKELIKETRKTFFSSAYDAIYEIFVSEGLTQKKPEYFFKNASFIIEELRKKSWEYYQENEKKFTSAMLKTLSYSDTFIKNLNGLDSVTYFIETYPEHIYSLILSNTQSRRSRAGAEFESIIELIFFGAKIPIDSQANIGKKIFDEKNLGKLVDFASPGVVQYSINKRITLLISAKTTLRERWQEVPEEMTRTGASRMLLATLDDKISNANLSILYEANIEIVTTKTNKLNNYNTIQSVITFEDLIKECYDNNIKWENFIYNDKYNQIVEHLTNQKNKHLNHDFVKDYYNERIENIYSKINKEKIK